MATLARFVSPMPCLCEVWYGKMLPAHKALNRKGWPPKAREDVELVVGWVKIPCRRSWTSTSAPSPSPLRAPTPSRSRRNREYRR